MTSKHRKIRLKVLTIVGTRPELIRLSATISLLDKFLDHVFVHTGQNYDYELNQIFFDELGIRQPDYFLEITNTSVGRAYGEVLIKIEQVIIKERPDAVLILGDTNSSVAAIIAKRYKVPIYHMEAGNRCFDLNVPEEINRRIVDHISDFNLVYTENARRNLISEGLPSRRIYVTGSPMREVINLYSDKIAESQVLQRLSLKKKDYFVVSAHREENVDNAENLGTIIRTLNIISKKYRKRIIVSTHPRTRKRIEESSVSTSNKLIQFSKPFGFCDYLSLQMNSICAISDSGTISEESAIMGFPAITIRNAMERPEAMDAGSIILTGVDENSILGALSFAISEGELRSGKSVPSEYQVENTSVRVFKIIIGTAKLSNKWDAISDNKIRGKR